MKNKKLFIISVVLLALLAFVAVVFKDMLFGSPVATYEEACLAPEEYTNKWVSYEVIGCLGEYCECSNSNVLLDASHEYYYLIWMEDGSIMPMAVSKKADKEYLDALTDATYDYVDYLTDYIEMDPRTFIGTIGTQETEAKQYYNETLTEMGVLGEPDFTVRYEYFNCTIGRGKYIVLFSLVALIPVAGIIGSFFEGNKSKKQINSETTYLPR